MNTLTESQYKNLVNGIYDCLMGASIACECGESASFGMGEMGEVREQAESIVDTWAEKENITLDF